MIRWWGGRFEVKVGCAPKAHYTSGTMIFKNPKP
jgi:hypothetical protein